MAYDELLDDRVAVAVYPWGATRKKMFGGTAYMLNGNLMTGVHGDDLILRLSPEEGDRAIESREARPFDMPRHTMRGWIMVGEADLDDDRLEQWLVQAREYVETLPPK